MSKIRRIPFILEIRDIWPDSIIAVNAIQNRLILNWMMVMEQWLYRSATHIVTVGNGYKKVLVEKGVQHEKVSVITNGADLTQFIPKTRTSYSGSPFICSFIGTLGMAAGLEIVLRAAEYLDSINESNIEFRLIGDGADYENLLNKVKEMNIKRIHFTGLVKKSEIPRFLEETDVCLIHLKKSELFKTVIPSKLFEAMASAVPVVIGVQGEAASIVKAAQCGLQFEPENQEKLCNCLLQLKEDRAQLTSMGKRGRAYLETHYDRDQLATQYIELVKQVCLKQSRNRYSPHT